MIRTSSLLLLAALGTTAWAAPAPVELTLEGPNALTVGARATFTVTGARPNERVGLYFGTLLGESCPAALTVCIPIDGDISSLQARADASGVATFTFRLPGTVSPGELRFASAGVFRGGDAVVSNVEQLRATDGSARIRVVHASPDAPAVDIYANGALLVPGLSYQEATAYVEVPAGTYDVDIRAAGAAPSSAPVFSVPGLTLTSNTDFTALAAGFLGSSDPADTFRVLALVDDFGTVSPDTYNVRVVHASADAPTVDVDVNNDGSSEIPALARFADTGTAPVALPAETSLQVGIAGGALAFTVPALPAGAAVTVVATGRLGAARASEADAFGLLAVIDGVGTAFLRENPKVYALHASPDAPTVDLKVGSATIVNDLSFGELSSAVQVPPGSYAIDIYNETGMAVVTSWTTPELVAGERYLAIATGFLGSTPGFTVLATNEAIDLDAEGATLQAIHASPDAPTVTPGIDIAGTFVALGPAFSFTGISPSITAPPGSYELALSVDGTTTALKFPELTLGAGDRFFAVANGSLGGGSFGITILDVTGPDITAVATVAPVP